MKYIKKFEELDEPQVGDYVICDELNIDQELKLFITNNIGQIEKYDHEQKSFQYIVKYENVPEDIIGHFTRYRRYMSKDEIIHFSKNKEELELILNSKKYNL